MKQFKVKSTIFFIVVVAAAMMLSACGSSTGGGGGATYSGPTDPAVVTSSNAKELAAKALGVGFVTEVTDSQAAAVTSSAKTITATKAGPSIGSSLVSGFVASSMSSLASDLEWMTGSDIMDGMPQRLIGSSPGGGGYAATYLRYDGVYTRTVVFDGVDTFTVTDAFANAKFIEEKNSGLNSYYDERNYPNGYFNRICSADGSVVQTYTFDFSAYIEPAPAKGIPSGWENPELTDEEKLDQAIANADIVLVNKTKNCSALFISRTELIQPVHDAALVTDMYGAGYNGYTEYQRVDTETYELDGAFTLADTTTNVEGSGSLETSGSFNSGFSGILVTESSNKYYDTNNSFSMVIDGTLTFAHTETGKIQEIPADAPVNAAYPTTMKSSGANGTISVKGGLDITWASTQYDGTTIEFTMNVANGGLDYTFNDTWSSVQASDIPAIQASLGVDETVEVTATEMYDRVDSAVVKGNATATCTVTKVVVSPVTQVIDFSLTSGEVTFTGTVDSDFTEVLNVSNSGSVFVPEASSDTTTVAMGATLSGSALIKHNNSYVALSGMIDVDLFQENPMEYVGPGLNTSPLWLNDNADRTVVTITIDNLNLRTNTFNSSFKGTIVETVDSVNPAAHNSLEFNMVIADHINGKSYQMEDYVITIDDAWEYTDASGVLRGAGVYVTGRFYHSDYGYVDLATDTSTPFLFGATFSSAQRSKRPGPGVGNLDFLLPVQGVATVHGADGSNAAFTVHGIIDSVNGDVSPVDYSITADGETIHYEWPDLETFIENNWLYQAFTSIMYAGGPR